MVAARVPAGLGTGGRELWRAVAAEHELDAPQKVQLLEACRAKDRLDQLDAILRGDVDTWTDLAEKLPVGSGVFEIRVTSALSKANETANMMKQLLASLRLPDSAGKKPSQRPGSRPAYKPGGTTGGTKKVSYLEQARQASKG